MVLKRTQRRLVDKLLTSLGVVAAIALFAMGGLAWWAYSFTTSTVRDQLSVQKIYFPDKGSAALTSLPAADQAKVSQYAGQQVLTGTQAKVFADNYIAVHLQKIGGGKTYSEISAEAIQQPNNAALQKQAATLFQGQTLRGLLLGDAYAFWTVGTIAKIAAIVLFAAGAVMTVLVLLDILRLAKA